MRARRLLPQTSHLILDDSLVVTYRRAPRNDRLGPVPRGVVLRMIENVVARRGYSCRMAPAIFVTLSRRWTSSHLETRDGVAYEDIDVPKNRALRVGSFTRIDDEPRSWGREIMAVKHEEVRFIRIERQSRTDGDDRRWTISATRDNSGPHPG